MFYKIYEKIKKYIIENYLILLFYLVFICVFTYQLPYYIMVSGGLIDINNRIVINNNEKINGSYNMCYVKELKATIPTYLYSLINSDWKLEPIDNYKYNESETNQDIYKRDKIMLDTANQSAIIAAFKASNKEYKVLSSNPIVLTVFEEADTDLKIGDEIIEVNGIKIDDQDKLKSNLQEKKVNEKITLKVINNNKEYERYAKLIEYEGNVIIGISIEYYRYIESDPEISFNFPKKEAGSSGGFILSLAIYDYISDEDLANGLKIAGTGTIDENGNVGEIGGVIYKLKGAVESKADVFFVPNNNNYEEAISYAKKKNYKIPIIGIDKLEDAINYLRNLKED